MTTPPNTQPDAAQIAREIRAGLEGVMLEDWQPMAVDPDRVATLLNAFDAQAREIAELREALNAESEACAKIADDQGEELAYGHATPKWIARAIRARSALRAKENPNG